MTVVNVLQASSYAVQLSWVAWNPTQATTYYMGFRLNVPPQATVTPVRGTAPVSGTVIAAGGTMYAGTVGSAENSTISVRVADTTDDAISTTLDMSTGAVSLNSTSLSTAITAGDSIVIKWATPATWATAPLQVSGHFSVVIRV